MLFYDINVINKVSNVINNVVYVIDNVVYRKKHDIKGYLSCQILRILARFILLIHNFKMSLKCTEMVSILTTYYHDISY